MSARTTTPPPRAAGPAGHGAPGTPGARLAGVRRRRRTPHLLAGVLLVVGCTAGGIIAAGQLTEHQDVLVLAEPVTVGERITEAQVRQVSMTLDPSVDALTTAALGQGSTAAYSLPAGTILTTGVVGVPAVPPAGEAVTAVALDPGQAPPDLQPGQTVQVIAAPVDDTAGGVDTPSSAWDAVVTAVDAGGQAQQEVATLQLDAQDAQEMASWPTEELRLVVVAGGER